VKLNICQERLQPCPFFLDLADATISDVAFSLDASAKISLNVSPVSAYPYLLRSGRVLEMNRVARGV
jgi:hypothetical protein